jgi:type VI secretion system protein ImpE
MTAQESWDAGRLKEAIQFAYSEVKSKPMDALIRHRLAMLLCFNGEFEKADRQLSTLSSVNSEVAVGVALSRQLLRAELCRQEFYTAGRLPEFVGEPSENLKLHIRASISVREGNQGEAVELLAEAESMRPHVGGHCDGEAFEDLRDLDDLVAPVLEALTSTGKYYWVPLNELISLEMPSPETLADLLWRPVRLSMEKGPEGLVFLPTLYAGSAQDDQENIRMGRATEWQGGDGAPVRGRGLRMLMVGDEARSVLDINRLQIKPQV